MVSIMDAKQFLCYKAYNSIDLKNAALVFSLPAPETRDRFVMLAGGPLAEIYKYETGQKRIFIFSIGCIVFEDFDIEETGIFIDALSKNIGEPDYRMMAVYNESHSITVTGQGTVYLWKDCPEQYPARDELTEIIAAILAKSTALSKAESDVDKLLDEADSHISGYQRGLLGGGTRRFTSAMAHIVRFEQQIAAGIRIFDRPASASASLQMRDAYDRLSEYFELEDRYGILESKIGELRRIVRTYSTLKFRKQENRLLYFEIFLLMLFPLFRLIEHIASDQSAVSFLRMIFPHLLQKFNIHC